jgi:hypothetical protein
MGSSVRVLAVMRMLTRASVVLVVMLLIVILVTAHWQLLDAIACRNDCYPVNAELRSRASPSTVFRLTAVSPYVSFVVYKENS